MRRSTSCPSAVSSRAQNPAGAGRRLEADGGHGIRRWDLENLDPSKLALHDYRAGLVLTPCTREDGQLQPDRSPDGGTRCSMDGSPQMGPLA